MAEAKFEVYGEDGSVVFSSADRVLRVLTVSDLNPSQTSYTDPEITPESTVAQGHSGGGGSVSNGAITFPPFQPRTGPPVIMY